MKNLICSGCKQEINTKKERYVHVEDYDKEKKEQESWWHLQCFKKAMNRDLTLLEKQAKEMLEKANGIFNNLPEELKPKEEYIVS